MFGEPLLIKIVLLFFFRFSKYSLPFLKGAAVPATQFLDKLTQIPSQLDQYILKPLFSFAGQGVIIDITEEIIDTLINNHYHKNSVVRDLKWNNITQFARV